MIGSKKKKQSKFLSGMSTRKPDAPGDAGSPVTEEPAAPQAPNHITLHEDLTISMKQDMTVDSMSVKGYLAITCRDPEFNSGCMNIQLDNEMSDPGTFVILETAKIRILHRKSTNREGLYSFENPRDLKSSLTSNHSRYFFRIFETGTQHRMRHTKVFCFSMLELEHRIHNR